MQYDSPFSAHRMHALKAEPVPDPQFQWETQAQQIIAGGRPADVSAVAVQMRYEPDHTTTAPAEMSQGRSAAKKPTNASASSHKSNKSKEYEKGEMRRGNSQAIKIHLENMDDEEIELLGSLDVDGNGEICLSEVIDLLKKEKKVEKDMKTMYKTFLGIVIVLFVLLLANTLATFAVVEMSKESKANGATLVTAGTGEVIQVSSSDMVISSSGALTSRQANARMLAECANGTCAASNASEKPIAVVENQVQRKMSSVIPSKILAQLKQIKLASKDKVSEFYLNVQSVMRVVTPGSRCGTVVKFFTVIGVVTFDDTVISVDAQAAGVLKTAGFELALGGAVGTNGRRLSEDVDAAGYFSFFENFEWKCDSLAAPKFFVKPYQVTVTQNHPCTSSKCTSVFKDKDGNTLQKPGYLKKDAALVSKFDSIITNTHSVKLVKYPNHPSQTFVEIRDMTSSTKYSFQMDTNGKAWHCSGKEKYSSDKEEFNISAYYTPVFNGYNEAHEGTSLREFLLVPIDVEKTPFVVKYVDDANTLLPHAVSFPQAREFEMNMESAKVDKYTKLTSPQADLLAEIYLKKTCMSEEQMKQQMIVPPARIMGNPYKEDLKVVLGHLDKLDDELVADDTKPFPFTAAAAKYGNYWASVGEMYYKDSKFYNKQDASTGSQGGRRMTGAVGSLLDSFFNASAMKNKAKAMVWGKLPKSFRIPLHSNCSVNISYEGSDKGSCIEIAPDKGCNPVAQKGVAAVGWYALGAQKGCMSPTSKNMTGQFCMGYSKSISKDYTVNMGWWSKTININCNVEAKACASVTGGLHHVADDRKKKAYGYTVAMNGHVNGSCAGVVSLKGDVNINAGPCGPGLDMRGKAGIMALQGCLSLGPFSSCFDLGNVDIIKGDGLDLPDCR